MLSLLGSTAGHVTPLLPSRDWLSRVGFQALLLTHEVRGGPAPSSPEELAAPVERSAFSSSSSSSVHQLEGSPMSLVLLEVSPWCWLGSDSGCICIFLLSPDQQRRQPGSPSSLLSNLADLFSGGEQSGGSRTFSVHL